MKFKAKFLGIPLLGVAIVGALWLLFRGQQQQVAATNQPNTSQSGVPATTSPATAVTPAVAGAQSVAPIPATGPGLPPQLTFNLGPAGNANTATQNIGNVFTGQVLSGVPGTGVAGPGQPEYATSGAPHNAGCGCSSSCNDCNASNSCAMNKTNFDGAGACLAPTPNTQIRSLAAAPNGQNAFSNLLSNLFLSGEGNNLSMNALQMIQYGLEEAQGNGSEGYTAPAQPALTYTRQQTVPGVPGYTSPWGPTAPSSTYLM